MSHPYRNLADHCFWLQGVAAPAARDIAALDPVVAPAFPLSRSDRIATAGQPTFVNPDRGARERP